MTEIHPEANLIELARAEDFTEDQFLRCFTETDRERDYIDRIKGPGAHLLEGPRGVGKSTILKKAELELDLNFNRDKSLGVYVNFKSSLLVETGTDQLGYSPFLCWVVAKLLEAFYKKSKRLNVIQSKVIEDIYEKYFSIPSKSTAMVIENVIRDLQALSSAVTDDKKAAIYKRLDTSNIDYYANVDSLSSFLHEISSSNSINKIVFLFDEAAHTFNEQQQETFFNFFKQLHGGSISVKAAVYPGITSYGGNFEIGQDAINISISNFDENIEASRRGLIKHFRSLLEKRLLKRDFGNFAKRGEALDMLILLSNGNPRMFLQAAAKVLVGKEISKRSALAATNDFVANELTSYHLGLIKRLPNFSSHIELGMELIKAHIIPELQKKNEGKGPEPKVQTIYFTIDDLVPHKIKRSLSLLEYSGFLYSKSVVKTAGRKQAPRYALHLGVAANDKVFHSDFSRDPDNAIKLLSLADYREFYSSDTRFEHLVSTHQAKETCPDGHQRQADGDYCPICGKKFAISKVLLDLLDDSISALPITEGIRTRIQLNGINTVGEILKLTESDLQQIHYIGIVRSRIIRNTAEEYISG